MSDRLKFCMLVGITKYQIIINGATVYRSVVYTVNNHIKQHINVHAKIVTPEISISQTDIVLKPTIGVPQTYGM